MSFQKKEWVIVFDCDGVMFDSRQANINYYNHVRHHFDLPSLTAEEVNYVHMHTADDSIRYIFKATELTAQALEYRNRIDYRPFISDMIIEPDLIEVLKILKPQAGLAIATNRSDTIGDVLTAYDLGKYFDIVVSSLDVDHPKPHPEPILKILDFFQADRQRCVYIGDSPIDGRTAGAAGVIFVSYRNRELEADFRIEHLMQILDVLKAIGDDL